MHRTLCWTILEMGVEGNKSSKDFIFHFLNISSDLFQICCYQSFMTVVDQETGAGATMWLMVVDNNSKERTTTRSIYTCIYTKEPHVLRRHCTIN